MEIERDFKFEYGGDTEAGASTGSRAATSMPNFTKSEIDAAIGTNASRRIESMFKQDGQPSGHRTQAKPRPKKRASVRPAAAKATLRQPKP